MKNYLRYALMIGAIAWSAIDLAQAADMAAPSTDVEQQYRNCSIGYYSGPRPGRARYTKDPWIWVVTPEFASKFCMPPEFVSADLKGAEAVAFKIDEDRDEERCGFGGNAEVCNRMKSLRFEIYISSSIKLPKSNDALFAQRPHLPSAFLISHSNEELDRLLKSSVQKHAKKNQPLGTRRIFDLQQISLLGVKDKKVVWPITNLDEKTFLSEIYEGIDYLAVEGSIGYFTNPRMESQNVPKFVIAFNKLGNKPFTYTGLMIDSFSHVIELPGAYLEKIRAADKTHGNDIEELGKRALKLPNK